MKKGLTQYGDVEFSLFFRKTFLRGMGYSDAAVDRPVVGITNTASAYNSCHANVPAMIEAIKRGVMLAGGIPFEFPVISIHEAFSSPTSMFLRNLMAMAVEEMVRSQPMDAVVLVGGCDKTVPALLMGALSADVPAILEVTGPMVTGSHKGERLGACTDCRRLWGGYRAGRIDAREIAEIGGKLVPGAGTCTVMGTASTMALVSEAIGMMLPGGACIPAVHGDRLRHAEATGARAVALAQEDLRPGRIVTPRSMQNALTILQAIGGSTNAVVHLAAIAGRAGFDLDLEEFNRIGGRTPVIVDLKPIGQHYMEDLNRAGGLAPVLRAVAPLLNTDCITVTGATLGENIAAAPAPWPQEVVAPVDRPIHHGGSIRVLRGNLAPNGAVIKHASATPALLRHTGRAVVFKSLADMAERLDADSLDVSADDVLILQNAGPKGGPGMPEAGYIPIPRKLAQQGVKDMVRISDARMSGTAFGTIVLHVSPEATEGGVFALVRDGDLVRLDVENGTLDLLVDERELAERRKLWKPPAVTAVRGYAQLYAQTVSQAEDGCDFDFLRKHPKGTGPGLPGAGGDAATETAGGEG
jgi:dihydroxy-acid dehydratase